MICPKCTSEIKSENLNIQADIGHCGNCNYTFKISENLSKEIEDGFEIDKPVKGTWMHRELHHIVVGATTQSPIAFFLVPFGLVWSGGSLGGIYGSQIITGDYNVVMSLFGIPFLLGSVLLWSFVLMSVAGKVELTLDKKGGKVFTGVGSIGLTKNFTWDEVSTVKENISNLRYPGSQGGEILLEGKKRISFGLGVNDNRRYYLLRALKSILGKVKSNKNFI